MTSFGPVTGNAATGRAAGERLELRHAERIGEARKHEDIGSCKMGREIRALLLAEEDDVRILLLERRLLRAVADHHLGARQIE